MPSDPSPAGEPGASAVHLPAVPPPLPPGLLEPWRVIAAGALAWLVVTILSFTVAGLQDWRPVCIAGLATGLLGTSIFLWQKSAAQRGARGAQVGLTFGRKRD
jgi:Protein of unknown function (DUF2530)